MLWSRRAILSLPLALAACGFSPVNTPGITLVGKISVSEPDSRESFLLVQRLEERLGRTSNAKYDLALNLKISETGLAEDATAELRRFNVLGQADYTLRNLTTGEITASGSVDNFTGYASAGTTIATLSAQRDANERLMTILADSIVQRLQLLQLDS
ncbi:MAG: LPS assembly lipoprotein LptE [Paracoccaceae bacterium]